MATFDEIETALLAPWTPIADGGLGQWTATPVAWENVALDPATLDAWMEVTIDPGQQKALTIDDVYVGTPVMMISAHTKPGVGKQAARQLLGAAVAMFKGIQFVAGTSTLRMYSVSRIVPLPADGWFKLSVQISFRLT